MIINVKTINCIRIISQKKKKKVSPSASTEIIDEETGKQGIVDMTGKSIRFDDPAIYHHFQKQYPKHVESTPR